MCTIKKHLFKKQNILINYIDSVIVFILFALSGSVCAQAEVATFSGDTLHIPVVIVDDLFVEVDLVLHNTSPIEFILSAASFLSEASEQGASIFDGTSLIIPVLCTVDVEYSVTLDLVSADPVIFRLSTATPLSTPSQLCETIRNDDAVQLSIDLSGSLQNPAFSPDGSSIIFTRFRNGYNTEPADLFIFNLQSETLSTLVSDGSGNVSLPGSVWNGATNSIIFSSSREPHDEIYIISEGGSSGSETQITQRAGLQAYEPSLSPDGQTTVFESHLLDVEDNGIIFKFDIDGSSSFFQLTSSDEDSRQPNWSPVGDKILFQKHQSKDLIDIWIMDIDGSNQTQVTSGSGEKTDASFTSDGQFIVFSSDFELEFSNLYIIPITGGAPARLSNFSGYDGAPSISPNNSKLVFESVEGDPDEASGTTIWIINNLD